MLTNNTSNVEQQFSQYNKEFIKSLDNLKAYESFYIAKSRNEINKIVNNIQKDIN